MCMRPLVRSPSTSSTRLRRPRTPRATDSKSKHTTPHTTNTPRHTKNTRALSRSFIPLPTKNTSVKLPIKTELPLYLDNQIKRRHFYTISIQPKQSQSNLLLFIHLLSTLAPSRQSIFYLFVFTDKTYEHPKNEPDFSFAPPR